MKNYFLGVGGSTFLWLIFMLWIFNYPTAISQAIAECILTLILMIGAIATIVGNYL